MNATEKRVVLDSAESFFAVLRSPDLGTVVSVIRSIMKNPEAALAFGKFNDRDVLDELIFQSMQAEGFTFIELLLGAIAAFDDPRAVARMRKMLNTSSHPKIIQLAVHRLSLEPVESVLDDLLPLLVQDQSPIHCSCVADALLGYEGLNSRQRLRATVANTQMADIGPELSSQTLPIWLKELAGWYGPQARAVLASRESDAFPLLAAQWANLDSETKVWLLLLGRNRAPLDLITPLQKALQDREKSVVLAGLDGIIRLGDLKILFAEALAPLVAHPDRDIRLYAIHAGAKADWRALLSQETDPELLAAMAKRIVEAEGLRSVDLLEPLLAHSDWKVRAGATSAFVAIGSPAIPLLRLRALSEDVSERVAASQALVELGDENWLEENLLLREFADS